MWNLSVSKFDRKHAIVNFIEIVGKQIYDFTPALLTDSSRVSRKPVQKALSDNHAECSAALDQPGVLFAADSTLHRPS